MVLDAPVIGRLVLPNTIYRNDATGIEWGGGWGGSTIRHSMDVTAEADGSTRLRHRERSSGLLCVLAWPASRYARTHDHRWSRTIEERFDPRERAGAP